MNMLTEKEKDFIVPRLVSILKNRKGKEKAITNKNLKKMLFSMRYNTTMPRIRLMINHIRRSGKIKNLLATSNGYYCSEDIQEIRNYINSLRNRASEVNSVANMLEFYLKNN